MSAVSLLVFLSLGLAIIGPVMTLYVRSRGVDMVAIGLMFAVFGVGEGIFGFVWGTVVDRAGVTRPLLIQTLVTAVCLCAFALISVVGVLFALRFVLAAAGAAIFPIGRGYLAGVVPRERKGTAMAVFAVLTSAGISGGSFAGAFIADQWGLSAPFFAAAALSVLAAVIVVVELRGESIAAVMNPRRNGIPQVDLPTAYARPLLVLCAMVSLGTGATSSSLTFTPILMTQFAGMPTTEVGLAYGVSGMLSLVAVMLSGVLSDRIGRKPILVAGLLLMLCGFLGLSVGRSFATIVPALLLTAFGAMTGPPILTLMSNVTPARSQGRSQGLFVVASDIGIVVGPTLTGLVWSVAGPAAAYLVCACFVVASLTIGITLVHERRWFTERTARLGASPA